MRARWRERLGVAAAALTLAACATARVDPGVLRVGDLYRVTVPGPGWEVAPTGRNELTLRHRDSQAGIFANGECGDSTAGRDVDALARSLLVGYRERETLENGQATVGGVPAAHTVLDVQVGSRVERMRMEAYVVKDDRCVYDLVYVAPVDAFEAQRRDFHRFVESFAKE